MEPKIMEIAERIRALREILEIGTEEMARVTGVSEEEYRALETGSQDFSFTFLYACAERFGVDMVELLTGENPHLSSYTVARRGEGLPIKRRRGFHYFHLAPRLKNKISEPFLVEAPFDEAVQNEPVPLSAHEGQEMDYILKGRMKFVYETHTEILGPGDCVYYDSGKGHGMIATGGEACEFLAIVMKKAD